MEKSLYTTKENNNGFNDFLNFNKIQVEIHIPFKGDNDSFS